MPRLVTISCRATTNRLKSAQHAGAGARLPARIDSFRLLQFVDQQHRNNPRLRNDVGEPFVEIHSKTARGQRVLDGEWVNAETVAGKIRLKAKYNDALDPRVVCAPYGWWQACSELGLPR